MTDAPVTAEASNESDPSAGAVTVRRAREGDAEAVAVLQDMANEGHLAAHDWAGAGRDWRRTGAARVAADDTEMGLSATIVAERGGAVVGMLNYAEAATDHEAGDGVGDETGDEVTRPFLALRRLLAPGLYLRAMAVLPAERGGGVASRLLDVALAAAREADEPAIGTIVHEANSRLIAHYERRGFRPVGEARVTRHHAYEPGSRLIALRLEIAGGEE